MTCLFGLFNFSPRLSWKKQVVHIVIMDEETYSLYGSLVLSICVLFWLTVFFCCLGPFIIWYTGEDEDGPTTLRESLRKSPYGQRSTPPPTPPFNSDFPSILRHTNNHKLDREDMPLEGNQPNGNSPGK